VTPLSQYDTAVPGDLEFERIWLPLKGISIRKTYIGILYYPTAITITQKYRGHLRIVFGDSGVVDTAVAKIGDFVVECLRDFSEISKTLYPCIRGLGEVVW
jgi:hypothetical protein